MLKGYSQPGQAERFIASGRLILATFALFAIWLDPTEPAEYFSTAYTLLSGYLCYSIAIVLVMWRAKLDCTRSTMSIHAFDLLIFFIFTYLTNGIASPFFAFFVFSLISATLRWQWRGVIYTIAVVFGVEIAMALHPVDLQRAHEYEMNHVIFRIGYLLIVAVLLGYLGAYEQRQRDKISRLAEWPKNISNDLYPIVSDILQRSSSLLSAPRTLLIWKEQEESLLHTACWSSGQFSHSIESPYTFGSLVVEALTGKNFLWCESLTPTSSVLYSSSTGVERWEGMPLHPELQRRFSIKSVLSLNLESESFSGHLFALDKKRMSPDDLVLGKIVSHAALRNLEQFYQMERRQNIAAMEERIRLARDLHDGLLQSLTCVTLKLGVADYLTTKKPQTTQQRLQDIQKLISVEQHKLRLFIQQLKLPDSSRPKWDVNLTQRIKELAEYVEHQWGLQVNINVNFGQSPLPWVMAQEIYFIVHESIINAARHANASSIQANISSSDHKLRIIVTDNGKGFPFVGRHNHASLTQMNFGPVILRERVTSLLGQLAIESGQGGARLDITLPIPDMLN